MRVGIVGHPKKVKRVIDVLGKYEKQTDFFALSLENEKTTTDIEELIALEQKVDWILFCGIYDYTLFNHYVQISKEVTYIQNDISSLYMTMLKISMEGRQLKGISIDGYAGNDLSKVCSELSLEKEAIFMEEFYRIEILDEIDLLMEKIYQHHCRNISRGARICITCMSLVYEKLKARGASVFLVENTEEAIVNRFIMAKQQFLLKNRDIGDIVILDIRTSYGMTMDVLQDDLSLASENVKVLESVYLFAHRLKCSVDVISQDHFLMISQKNRLEQETNLFTKFSLLQEIKPMISSKISVGIGYGNGLNEVRNHAKMALGLAEKVHESCIYVVFDELHVRGPIKYDMLAYREEDQHIYHQRIAAETGLSINTVEKMANIYQQYKNEPLTIGQLAVLYGASEKTMYRIAEKLEEKGYVAGGGYKMKNQTGRPSRMLRLLF